MPASYTEAYVLQKRRFKCPIDRFRSRLESGATQWRDSAVNTYRFHPPLVPLAQRTSAPLRARAKIRARTPEAGHAEAKQTDRARSGNGRFRAVRTPLRGENRSAPRGSESFRSTVNVGYVASDRCPQGPTAHGRFRLASPGSNARPILDRLANSGRGASRGMPPSPAVVARKQPRSRRRDPGALIRPRHIGRLTCRRRVNSRASATRARRYARVRARPGRPAGRRPRRRHRRRTGKSGKSTRSQRYHTHFPDNRTATQL